MSVNIRPATQSDIPSLAAIYNHYVSNSDATFELTPVSLDERFAWFSQYSETGPIRVLVAQESDTCVGYATSSVFDPKQIYASSIEVGIYVAPGFTHLGIGTLFYAALLEILEAEPSIERLVAGVKLPNPGSIALHQKFGFDRVGTFTRVGSRNGAFFDLCWLDRPVRPAA